MKILFIAPAILLFMCSCGTSTTNNEAKSADSASPSHSTAIDTIKQPTGVDNSSAISTDTAAMNVQNTMKKKDSVSKTKSK